MRRTLLRHAKAAPGPSSTSSCSSSAAAAAAAAAASASCSSAPAASPLLTRTPAAHAASVLAALRSEPAYTARYRMPPRNGGSSLLVQQVPGPSSSSAAATSVAPGSQGRSNTAAAAAAGSQPSASTGLLSGASAPRGQSSPRPSHAPQTSSSKRSTAGLYTSAAAPAAQSSESTAAAPPKGEQEEEDTWAFGGGASSHAAGQAGEPRAVEAAAAAAQRPAFVGSSSAGKGAVNGYGKRRGGSHGAAQSPAAADQASSSTRAAQKEEQMAREYKHEYAPTSRAPRAMPHHTYFSSPSTSFNVGAAGAAGALPKTNAHGSQSAIHGLGTPGAGSSDGKLRKKKTALIMPGQGSQYVAMSQDVYRAFRSARDVWAEAEEALLSGRSQLAEWEERATSPAQREAFEAELKKSSSWDRMQGMTSSGTAVARSRRGWLRDLVFSGDQLNLTRAENAQPAILACTLSILAVMQKEFDVDLIKEHVSLAAGHGTGIYASLVASGAVDIGDATRLLRHRGLMSSKCVEESPVLFPPGCERPDTIYESWAFANSGSGKGAELLSSVAVDAGGVPPTSPATDADVVHAEKGGLDGQPQRRGWKRSQMSGVMVRPGKLGATLRAVEATQADIKAGAVKDVATDEVVEIANVNNNLQVVLSGTRVGVSLASDRLRALGLGARAVNLPVSGPYHSSLMLPAAEALQPTIVHLPLRAPQGFRIVSSNKGAPLLDDVDAIRADLSGATARRVEWLDSIERLVAEGVQRFICLGPGRACAHLLSKELAYRDRLRVAQGMQPAEYEVWSITSVEDIEQLGDVLNRLSVSEGASRLVEHATDSVVAI